MDKQSWQEIIKIWEGLQGFRKVQKELFRAGIHQLNQATLNKLLPEHKFEIIFSKREMLQKINATLANEHDNRKLIEELEAEKAELDDVEEDIILKKETESFIYEWVLHDEIGKPHSNLDGFVKIFDKEKPTRAGLLDWQVSADPILYLAELDANEKRIHVSYGKDGFALIRSNKDGASWTHTLEQDYPALKNAVFGTVSVKSGSDKTYTDGDPECSSIAEEVASTPLENGQTLLENNIELINTYQKELALLLEQ